MKFLERNGPSGEFEGLLLHGVAAAIERLNQPIQDLCFFEGVRAVLLTDAFQELSTHDDGFVIATLGNQETQRDAVRFEVCSCFLLGQQAERSQGENEEQDHPREGAKRHRKPQVAC